MPAPSSPPPSDEAGAILSPRQLNRWLDVNPVSALTRTQTYLTVPLFGLINQWKGYSELVGAYNFTAGRNFTLPAYTAPVEPNYMLCVSWFGLDGVVHRYKLWEDAGEVFYFDAPLYTGQLIKGNFRFEIWSVLPASVTQYILAGAGTATVNQVYVQTTPTLFEGQSVAINVFSPGGTTWNVTNGIVTYYTAESLTAPPFSIYTVGTGIAPAPYGYVIGDSIQLTDLTFYTSVRGNYDYYWQTDNALSAASALVTDFNIVDNSDSSWTAPGNSASTVNN